jgi:hypothetical protein
MSTRDGVWGRAGVFVVCLRVVRAVKCCDTHWPTRLHSLPGSDFAVLATAHIPQRLTRDWTYAIGLSR